MDYDKKETPQWYLCSSCHAGGVRLYRQFNIFLSHITLLCTACGLKHQKMRVPDGEHTIGWLVAAVPTEDESTYWGYSSVPDRGVTWWNGLPVEPIPAADTTALPASDAKKGGE